ncbi:MAG TPA: glycosyltransferase family 39 protein [Thermoanaerobaculia bacterium]|nr:glycosyltransferase family 39 protein [Thermoanaerobaculia bacterium]
MAAPRRDLVILLVLFSLVAVIRVTAPSDLATGDQPYQSAYVRDITERGAWIVQHLEDGTPATKPPLYNWLAAVPILIAGTTTEFLLKLPSLIAGLLTLLLTWSIARQLAGDRAALFTGVLLVCSTMFSKQIYFARTDMLLTLFVVAQIWAAVRVRPVAYWTFAALALLTKGPIGIAIPLLGLLVWWWRDGRLREQTRAMYLVPGLLLSLIPLGAWFAAALSVGGEGVWQQLVVRETIDRFAEGSKSKEHKHFLYYVPHFFARMAPASFFAVIAMIAMRARRNEETIRAMFVSAWWFLVPFVMLSLVPSKRVDRLFPIFPAVCVLAGWALDRWFSGERVRGTSIALYVIGGAIIVAGLVVAIGYPFIVSGILLVAAGTAMLVNIRRRAAMPFIASLALAMLVVIGVYQHRLSEPARGKPNAVTQRAQRNAEMAERLCVPLRSLRLCV